MSAKLQTEIDRATKPDLFARCFFTMVCERDEAIWNEAWQRGFNEAQRDSAACWNRNLQTTVRNLKNEGYVQASGLVKLLRKTKGVVGPEDWERIGKECDELI